MYFCHHSWLCDNFWKWNSDVSGLLFVAISDSFSHIMCRCAVSFVFSGYAVSFVVFVVDGHNFVEQAAGNSDYGFQSVWGVVTIYILPVAKD